MKLRFLILACALFAALPAHADEPQARAVALMNNCPVKKISVYQADPGSMGDTIYRVDCNMPKATDPNAPPAANALLVECDQSLCYLLRAVPPGQ
ncbi:MAG: hypothetical protein KGI97_08610 [Alphaproteobacteria bacterium]|nr:hypothetical protein [Alphaproteobacteria bacterium]